MILTGRPIFRGIVKGKALVSSHMISFYGGVDPETGIIVEMNHELKGKSIANVVLVFPTGKGSTVGSYTLYRLKENGCAPLAIVNVECEPITAVGCILAEIPCVDQIPIEKIPNGVEITVDGDRGVIEFDVE